MKSPKHRITFKVLTGYIILGVLATICGVLLFSEIKTFTQIQKQDISDRSKIVKVGSLIADIYENESMSRVAIQLNSVKKFNEYVAENEQLLLKIDSLNFIVDNEFQAVILDSIKLIIDDKLKNIIGLKKLKGADNSDESIDTAIEKLSSIDSILGKMFQTDFTKNLKALDRKTRQNIEEYMKILDGYNPEKSNENLDQSQVDSLLTVSKNMLKEAQRGIDIQRRSLQRKERELVENDIVISRKLRELLNALERDIVEHTHTINIQREKTLNHSRNIILFAAAVGFTIMIVFSIIFLNDFWKGQRYRKQLEEAHETTSSLLKSREQIISMVSHDLRTPLNTISGYSELLQKSTESTKEINYIEHIQSASAYMAQLVDDLLEFSKLENNNISIAAAPFDLEKLIHEIVKNSESLVQNKSINFVVDVEESINSFVVSDSFRIKQILYNLIINAYKFTNQGTITVKSFIEKDKNKNMLCIAVKDTGTGIGKDQQKNIFKAFTQGNNAKENKQHGFGLGLTISKKLSELLGGTIILESEMGKGSTFTLKIPVVFSEKVVKTEKFVKTELLFDIKILVVEDDVSMRQLLKDLLAQYGIVSHIFENAQKALEVIDTLSYDLVLTDIQLPKMNGIHFMEVLKKRESYQQQPIVAMTGRSNLSVEDYKDSGFSEVLLKPFSTERLEHVLSQFFESNLSKEKHQINKEILKKAEGFNLDSLSSFLGNDTDAIKNTLSVFLEDTQKNRILLIQAEKENDISAINEISHKMLSMFKQLEVVAVIPYLEIFETTINVKSSHFKEFEKVLDVFISSLKSVVD
ncbi:ATP-binding protein [Wenyingzhuangia sp. 1_MG-2023]|nr:ATP-binding protein [Wenyingzhuangia sp. 1_MG-2023]